MSKGHNNVTDAEKKRVIKFLQGLGPYQADAWSNSYYSEILEFLEGRNEANRSRPTE